MGRSKIFIIAVIMGSLIIVFLGYPLLENDNKKDGDESHHNERRSANYEEAHKAHQIETRSVLHSQREEAHHDKAHEEEHKTGGTALHHESHPHPTRLPHHPHPHHAFDDLSEAGVY